MRGSNAQRSEGLGEGKRKVDVEGGKGGEMLDSCLLPYHKNASRGRSGRRASGLWGEAGVVRWARGDLAVWYVRVREQGRGVSKIRVDGPSLRG